VALRFKLTFSHSWFSAVDAASGRWRTATNWFPKYMGEPETAEHKPGRETSDCGSGYDDRSEQQTGCATCLYWGQYSLWQGHDSRLHRCVCMQQMSY